jgi:transcriptional pleiotropic regulator of transition state genes
MKSTGIVRRVDDLGRFVIPKEIRDTKEFKEGTPLEIFTEGDDIILREYKPGCVICGNVTNNRVGDALICKKCIQIIKEM